MMYYGASALAGFEIVILLALQLTAGNMYQVTGLVIAALMAGLAAGAGWGIKLPGTSAVRTGAILLLMYYVLIGVLFNVILSIRSTSIATVIIIISTFIPGFLTGLIFRELTVTENQDSLPAVVYSADLAGSAFGFIIISAFMVPAFGLRISVFFLVMLILAGLLFGTNRRK